MGRVGWPAASQPGQLRLPSSPLLRLVRHHARRSRLECRPSALFLLAPRLADAHPPFRAVLWGALLVAGALLWVWWGVLFLSYEMRRPLLAGEAGGAGAVPPADAPHLSASRTNSAGVTGWRMRR